MIFNLILAQSSSQLSPRRGDEQHPQGFPSSGYRPAYGPSRRAPGGNRHNHQPLRPLVGFGRTAWSLRHRRWRRRRPWRSPSARRPHKCSLVAYEKHAPRRAPAPPAIFQLARYFTSERRTSTQGSDQRTDDAAGIKPVVVRIESGLSISRERRNPIPTSPAMKHATPSVHNRTALFLSSRKTIGHPRRMPAAFGFGHGGKLQPDAAQHGEPLHRSAQQQAP